MDSKQIITYLKQRKDNIKRNMAIAKERGDKEREKYYNAQYVEVSDIIKSIRG